MQLSPRAHTIITWAVATLLSAALVWVLLHYVVSVGNYVDPTRGKKFCVVTKSGLMWRGEVARGRTALVKTPENGDLLLRIAYMPGDTVNICDARTSVRTDRSAVATYITLPHVPYSTLRQMHEEHKHITHKEPLSDTLRLRVNQREANWKYWTYTYPQKNETDLRTYPQEVGLGYNYYHWGPMILPRKGQTMILDKKRMIIYGKLIRDNESSEPKIGEKITFKHNYYFAICDDRDVAYDSRTFGPIPDNKILGRARIIK